MGHRLFLLRHGQTEWSATGRHTGRTDIPLTQAGEDQARAVRLTEKPPLVWSSPRRRALRTAELAGLTVTETTEDLAEWDYGDYEGVTTDEIRETVPGWTVWTHPIPGGESATDVAARADAVIARFRAAGSDVIAVGHGHFSRVLVTRWIGLPAVSGVHFAVDPASITILGDERGVPQIDHLNLPPS